MVRVFYEGILQTKSMSIATLKEHCSHFLLEWKCYRQVMTSDCKQICIQRQSRLVTRTCLSRNNDCVFMVECSYKSHTGSVVASYVSCCTCHIRDMSRLHQSMSIVVKSSTRLVTDTKYNVYSGHLCDIDIIGEFLCTLHMCELHKVYNCNTCV